MDGTLPAPVADAVEVALDVGPLVGHRTGVGVVVAGLVDALASDERVRLTPYVLSARARLDAGVRRLPLPAAVAHRLWAATGGPAVDRWLGGAHVVHGTNYVVPPSRRPRLVSVYDGWFLAHPEQAAPAVRRAGAVLRRAVATGAWVHVTSTATAERVGDLLATDRVVTIHSGPPPPLGAPVPPSGAWLDHLAGRPFIVSIGTLERRKGLATLVEAFGRAGNQFDDVVLVLAGAPGDDEVAVRAAIDALPANRRHDVHLTGPVSTATKSWLVREAAMLAYPSLDEGFGFPLLEAQDAGTPVVATRAGSIPEIAGSGAELVPVGDVDALAVGLLRVLGDDERRDELVRAGTANLARFSWTAAAAQHVELYRRLAASS